jgi:hypothetical protein
MKIIQIWVFIIFVLIDCTLFTIYALRLTHWRIQRIGTSRIFCQNRVQIAHIASSSLKTKNIGGPSIPLWKSNSMVEPHFENAWIHPFDMFKLKFLVQFMGVGWVGHCSCIKDFFPILTEICFYNAIKLPLIYYCDFLRNLLSTAWVTLTFCQCILVGFLFVTLSSQLQPNDEICTQLSLSLSL